MLVFVSLSHERTQYHAARPRELAPIAALGLGLPMSGPDVISLRRRAMDLLAHREHSRRELAGKLQARFPEASLASIDAALAKLASENLQSDQRFAEDYLRMRMRRGFGWLHIRADLQARGVDDSVIAALERPDEEWLALAEDLVSSRQRGNGALAPGSRDHQRLFRFLQGRGFPAEISHKSLQSRICKEVL